MITLRMRKLGQPEIRRRPQKREPKLNWEALQDEDKRREYSALTGEKITEIDQDRDIKWEKVAKVMTKSVLEVCGQRRKELMTPWVAGRETRLEELRQGISDAIQEVRQKKAAHSQHRSEETERELKEAISKRKVRRRDQRVALRAWEREYWDGIIEEMREAQQMGKYGQMYRMLRQLGQRGSSKAAPSRFFTSEEFKDHFSQVSQHEFENDAESWRRTIAKIDDKRNRSENEEAGNKLEETPSEEEIRKAMKEMKDKAPGEDEVRIRYIREAAEPVQRYVIKMVQKMFDEDPKEWEEVIGKGLVIPLFKKGDRKDRNNYRGVCLLQMGSRILARVLATRIRKWTEEVHLVDDNQQGFRSGRSTMDATQIMVRIQEETTQMEKDKRALNMDISDSPEDAGAVLLDITKAYPRVNRPAMWAILERAGMKERCLRTIRGIHEKTTYKVKGREECSSEWRANRGLREGCATSPALFNIYHAEAMRQAKKERQEERTRIGQTAGVKWMYTPGNALPPVSTNKAMSSSDAIQEMVTEAMFADDTTLIGTRAELNQSVKTVKQVMGNFEEKCHDGKEEWVFFGKEGSEEVRVLGTWLGREKDMKERLARGNRAWWTIRKRLCKTRVSAKTQARIIEACVESTMLFDCAARPWMQKEMKRLQQQIDRSYRYVWMDKKGGPGLRQMEAKGVNMYDIRRQLEVDTMETKIARRTLERIGHVARMDNGRMTKKVVAGWLKKDSAVPGRKSRKNTTPTFWRKTLRSAGIDADTMDRKAADRGTWRSICQQETKRRQRIEETRCKRRDEPAQEDDTRNTPPEEQNVCDWPDCGRRFEKKIGLVQHQRIKHKRQDRRFQCERCQQTFKQMGNLTNHKKICNGAKQAGECPWCKKIVSKSNAARHVKGCSKNPEVHRRETERQEDREENQDTVGERRPQELQQPGGDGDDHETGRQPRGGTRRLGNRTRGTIEPRWPCCYCSKEVSGGIMCTETRKWCHFKCGRVTYTAVRRWTDAEVGSWKCPRH